MMELVEKIFAILCSLVMVVAGSDEVPLCPSSCSCSSFDPSTEGFCRGCPTESTPSVALRIKCESVGLTDFPPDISPKVNWLDLTKNNLTILGSKSLSETPNLIHLKLSQNNISRIHDNVFQGLNNIQVLDLDLNNLTVLAQATFAGAESLIHLDLSGNRLETVDHLFTGLRELSRLDLRNNRLAQLTPHTFRGLASLRYLLLTSNRIYYVDRRTFRPLEKLVYVVLKGNPIGDQALRFHFQSSFLTYLDVSECGFKEVPKGLPGSLRYLQLRRNNLTTLARNTFVECPYLTILVLDENRISSIEDRTFEHMTQLQQLWLNNNLLTKIPKPVPASIERLLMDLNRVEEIGHASFPVRSQMSTLSLMGNNITSVSPEAFDALEKLKTLDLSNNKIRRLHRHTFDHLRQVKTLQLSGNPLHSLDTGCFFGLVSLATLSLAYVPSDRPSIKDSVFEDLTQLSRLDLDSSPGLVSAIVTSDRLLTSLGRVQELSIRSSDLTHLRPNFFQFLESLTTFRLSSTRWRCDRSLIWLRDWMASTTLRLDDGDENRCGTPRILHGRSLLSLKTHEFSDIVEHYPTIDTQQEDYDDTPTPLMTDPSGAVSKLPDNAITSASPFPVGYDIENFKPDEIEIDSIYEAENFLPPTGNQNRSSSNIWDSHEFENETDDFRSFDPLIRTSESKTTTQTGNDRSLSTVSYSRKTLAIVIVTVAATLVIAIVIIGVIIHLTSDRRSRRMRIPKAEGPLKGREAIPYKHKNGILFYTPATGKSDSDAPDLIRKTTSGEAMTLIPGRDFNHEGPMRVYKWEDF